MAKLWMTALRLEYDDNDVDRIQLKNFLRGMDKEMLDTLTRYPSHEDKLEHQHLWNTIKACVFDSAVAAGEITINNDEYPLKGGGGTDCVKDRKNAIDSMFRSLEIAKAATEESRQLAVDIKATKEQYPYGQLQAWYNTAVAAVKELMTKDGTPNKLKASLYAAIKLYDDAVKRCSDKDI